MFHVIGSPVNLNFHMLHGRKHQFPPECRTVPFRPAVGGVLALTLMLIQLHRRKGKRGHALHPTGRGRYTVAAMC